MPLFVVLRRPARIAPAGSPPAIDLSGHLLTGATAGIRLLMLTSCRKSEILTLRWTDVDLEAAEIHLGDAKTGPRAVQLPPTAVGLLEALPRQKDSP